MALVLIKVPEKIRKYIFAMIKPFITAQNRLLHIDFSEFHLVKKLNYMNMEKNYMHEEKNQSEGDLLSFCTILID